MGRAGERGRWGPFCLYGLRSSELHSLPLGAAAQPGRCITGGQGPSEGASKIRRPSMDEVACNGDELLTREQEKSKEGRREGRISDAAVSLWSAMMTGRSSLSSCVVCTRACAYLSPANHWAFAGRRPMQCNAMPKHDMGRGGHGNLLAIPWSSIVAWSQSLARITRFGCALGLEAECGWRLTWRGGRLTECSLGLTECGWRCG